jgi:hypothetical protein
MLLCSYGGFISPFFLAFGAVAEQLGSGLQNRVHRCESGPRLHLFGLDEIQ